MRGTESGTAIVAGLLLTVLVGGCAEEQRRGSANPDQTPPAAPP